MAWRYLPHLVLILLGILGWGVGLVKTLGTRVSRGARRSWLGFSLACAALALAGGMLMADQVMPPVPARIMLPDLVADGL